MTCVTITGCRHPYSCCSHPLAAQILHRGDRNELDMLQQPGGALSNPADIGHQVILQNLVEPKALPQLPVPSTGGALAGQRTRLRTRTVRGVVIVEATGRLGDVVGDLDLAIELALAGAPRGVVCDLSAVLEDAEPVAVEVLATAGRHVRDWQGTPVAVACPDRRLREVLAAHPLGGHLTLSGSLFSAINEVLAMCYQTKISPVTSASSTNLDWLAGLCAW